MNKGVLREVVGGPAGDGDRVFEVCEEQSSLAAGDLFADKDDAEADLVVPAHEHFNVKL